MTHRNRIVSRASFVWLKPLAVLAVSAVLCDCSNSNDSGGSSGTGGSFTTGGRTGTGGAPPSGGTSNSTGGTHATGGTNGATGGSSAIGGGSAVGGSSAIGGSLAVGGSSAVGGSLAVGGSGTTTGSSVGGTTSSVGGAAAGGLSSLGGAPETGGSHTGVGGTTSADAGNETDAATDAGSEPTFTEVYAIISSRCLACHIPGGSGVNGGHLDMSTKELAYTDLLGSNGTGAPAVGTVAGSSGATCTSKAGLLRVAPGSAASSLLWLKVNSKLQAVTNPTAEPPCGSPMPLGATNGPLTQEQIDTIAAWIDEDAPNN